jgi:NADPH2:quinone reductase
MTNAIRIHQYGGPEALVWEAVTVPDPGPGEALVRQSAVGLNFIDIYHRTGLYPVPALPAVIGLEGAGVIEKVGSGVTDLRPGDRVAYAGGPLGGYAEARVIPAARLVKLPEAISERQAAAMMLQGLTVQYLLRRLRPLQPGETILFHAAAGGCGLIACQWAKHLGARVIGTARGAEKAAIARAHGADEVIDYDQEDLVARVRELTGGKGVPVVYDGIGKDTFARSLDCLATRGMMVSFGNASGTVAPIDIGMLAKGSYFLSRPALAHYVADRGELVAAAAELFAVVQSGAVRIAVNQTYPLRQAADARRDLENRKTTGSTVLLVE